jgi:hypothetical protein
MHRVLFNCSLAAAALALWHGAPEAQAAQPFFGEAVATPAPAAADLNSMDPLTGLEKRIRDVEAQQQELTRSLQTQIAQLERRFQQGGIHTTLQGSQGRNAPAPEDLGLEVERLLREAEGGPEIAPPAQKAAEIDIEALLKAGEARREAPAPELGAGLGARLSEYNPNISVIGDFAGVLSSAPENWNGGRYIRASDFEHGNVDGFAMRETELLMTAAIDPYAEGMAKLAFLEEGVELEEGYILFHDYPFTDRLPWRMRDVHTKLGLFRMGFGPLNSVDDHDLPTVDRPLAIQRFLGDEGLIRAGVSASKVIPIREPWASELTLEFVNGEPPGDLPGAPPVAGIDYPMGLIHYSLFREREPVPGGEQCLRYGYRPRVPWGYRSLELGATFLATGSRSPDGSEDLYSLMQGVDFLWQWWDPRADSYLQYLLQGEVFVSELEQPGDGVRGDVGGYLVGQVRLNRRWFAGLRFDITEFPEHDGHQVAGTPCLTYFFTEFNRARLQYQYLKQEIENEGIEEAHTVSFQLVFAFGAHPPEPYYITQRF